MNPKPPELLFRPGQVITCNSWRKPAPKYVVERIVQGVYVLRHQSGSIEKHSLNWVHARYKLDVRASEERAITKVLKKYENESQNS